MAAPFLVLAPDGRDAEVIGLVLAEVGLATRTCADLSAVCRALDGEATGLLVAEGALTQDLDALVACLEAQPPWSDLPVLVLTARGRRTAQPGRGDLFRRLGNVTLLDRPLHAEALQSAARAADRARRRQYRTRAHLAEIARTNGRLEQRVAERTRELHAEMAERRRVEDELRQAQKMEAVGQLTGGIAHDFNNILQVVLGNLHALRAKLPDGDDRRRHVDMAATASDRAATLTGRLLAFARRQSLAPESLDLNALVAAMDGLLQRSVGESVRIETALAADLWPTWADANQVESALLNLVLNARDAMPGGGRLRIATANATLDGTSDLPAGAFVALSVHDSGSGMTPDVVERAFEPFFTTKPIGQGTGLGLSQVYGFARQSGGAATIASEPERGTTVTLYLPRHDGTPAAPPPPVAATPRPPAADAGETVLVVEDEALVLMLWAETLESQGYRVLQATDPQAAIAILKSAAAIDLLVSDVGLPGMNGRELAAAARRLRPGLKVLFLTGYAHHAAFGPESLEPGTRLLGKPVAVDGLLAQVRALLDEP
ncbi:ATP-binding protein [Azospirillum sp. ST 5-10]|uniref:ATP-binding protein n=1 Tax=unclassified Azospirillum TaxID=2630922 RepID=UPI003F4A39A5